MTEPSLFPDLQSVELPPPPEPVSADRRRTMRQKADIARGRHPLTGLALIGGDATCGRCAHRFLVHANRTWPKCDVFGASHGSSYGLPCVVARVLEVPTRS